MDVAFISAGVVLILVAIIDALWTTLWVDGGAGPLSSRFTRMARLSAVRLAQRGHRRKLSLVGPVVLTGTVVLWVLLLWLGWTLVFAGGDASLIATRTGQPANWSGRVYFVAYTIFTMGNGDFTPNGAKWQLLASLTNGSGMFIVTLAITYLLSVISAVVNKRALSTQIMGLGSTPDKIIRGAWDGRNLGRLDLPLNGLAADLAQLSQQYLAYPVLQYYHPDRHEKSPAVAVAVLDEALSIIRLGVPAEARPNPMVVNSACASVAAFLEAMPYASVSAAPHPPPIPNLDSLRSAGIPLSCNVDVEAALADQCQRRRTLLGLIRSDGWTWEAVLNG